MKTRSGRKRAEVAGKAAASKAAKQEAAAPAAPTLANVTAEQLTSLVNAVIKKEDVIGRGEGKAFVLAKAGEYLQKMGIAGSVEDRGLGLAAHRCEDKSSGTRAREVQSSCARGTVTLSPR